MSESVAQLIGFEGEDVVRFAPVSVEDEFLHPPAASGHYSASETSYFGFNIPDHAVNGEIYVWFHPALRSISASVYIWRGLKGSTLAGDYINHHHFLPWPEDGIADYRIEPLNLAIRVIDPLRSVEIAMDDRARGVAFSLRLDAIMPPCGRPGGHHFTQAMKTSGWLDLYGERMTIDGYFSRDRSWGSERRESPMAMPPLTWMVGVVDKDFAFHALAHDDPALSPEWAEAFPAVKPGGNLFWGYVWKDGELVPVTAARKRTIRDAGGLAPIRIEMVLDDAAGRSFDVTGDVAARLPWQTWQNMNTFFCQTRWTIDGRIGWGDTQDVQFNDFTRLFAR